MLLNSRMKMTIHIIGLFILTMFFCASSFAGARFVTTPYFKISLDQAMKQVDISTQNIRGVHIYVYSAEYKNVKAYSHLSVFVGDVIPENEINNSDQAQKEFIAMTVNEINKRFNSKRFNLPKVDIYTIYNGVKAVQVKNRKFMVYSAVNERNDIMTIYTTMHNKTLYGFCITVTSDTSVNPEKIKTISKSLIDSAMQVQFLSP